MATGWDLGRKAGSSRPSRFVFWDPCIGLDPILVQEPRAFLIGQALIVASGLCLLAACLALLPAN